jgi:hypothetical protein
LPSLNQARAERQRAFVVGKVRMPGVPMHFWLWTAVGISLFGIVYWRVAQGQIESARSRVMADQRAMAVALGPKLLPFRDRVEAWAKELAGEFAGNFVAPEAELAKIEEAGSVYLRLRLQNAKNVKTLRKAVQGSLRDGFTSCLFVGKPAPADPTVGKACRTLGDCPSGNLCNEWNVCAAPHQPYNLRLVYRTLRVLSSDWTDEVHLATSELALSAYERDLENVAKHDVPVTVDLLSRSRYFTLVLDEDPPTGLPPELPNSGETPEERVQRVPHAARVGIWDLKDNTPLLRLRADAAGEFVMLGRKNLPSAENRAAQERQVNSCQLALRVREALGDKGDPPPAAIPQ